ncbi:MAG: ATP-binding protein [Promethearchaeati archaeon SRVP18_Atabeyarchaeia-1]
MLNELPPEKLRNDVKPQTFSCESTEELTPSEEIVGQERAVRALKFGLNIKERGFNIYVAGVPGSGRKTAVKAFLEEMAKRKPVPSDWCYVNNFSNPFTSRAIKLPPGRGKEFKKDMKSFVESVRTILPKAFESEDYATRRDAVIKSVEEKREQLLEQLNAKAQQAGFALRTTQIGIVTVPVVKGKPLSDEEFMALPPQAKEEIRKRSDDLTSQLRLAFIQVRSLEKEAGEKVEELNKEVTIFAIGHLVDSLVEKYGEVPDVKTYLDEVRNDILENIVQFLKEPETPQTPVPVPWMKELPFRKYEVNVIVDNSALKGAPVILELNPTYQNLFGLVEKEAQFGVLTTDFTLIRGGSFHKANGGYLVLPAEDLLINPLSYDAIKKALMNERLSIEEIAEKLGYVTTKGLRPAPIPLDAKVILIGGSEIYQQLYMLDAEFKELFKVKAEFDTTMDRSDKNMEKYAASICGVCEREKLRHLDVSGLSQLIAYSSRLAEDQKKLSTRFGDIADIIREASYYATQDKSEYISEKHVKKAMDERFYRSSLVQEKIREMIERNVILINTDGESVGQVNGLSVMSMGDFMFGAPSRVTASVGLGKEGIVDIQREAKMGGPIHTKGVLILSGYLMDKFTQDKPLSLSSHLVFEQSYGMVEGDSASSTELYAILSALSGAPIKQHFAVTGSVNQKGEVQAIGGVNEKIEGYFEVCKAKGLNGKQSVLIPESNADNLMLKEEVVQAVKQGKFHIYPVKTIDQGIEMLTGVKAGTRGKDGTFEAGTICYRVDKRLAAMAEKLKEAPRGLSKEKRKRETNDEEETEE